MIGVFGYDEILIDPVSDGYDLSGPDGVVATARRRPVPWQRMAADFFLSGRTTHAERTFDLLDTSGTPRYVMTKPRGRGVDFAVQVARADGEPVGAAACDYKLRALDYECRWSTVNGAGTERLEFNPLRLFDGEGERLAAIDATYHGFPRQVRYLAQFSADTPDEQRAMVLAVQLAFLTR